jgi:ribosomal protein S18 acetylase RimI-like enzyme
MKLVITTKTKLTTKPISTFFKNLTLYEIDTAAQLEQESSKNPWSKKQLSESISNPNNVCYLLEVKSKIIGFIIAMPSVDSADILNLAVHKDFKRKGYGSSLIEYLSLGSKAGKFCSYCVVFKSWIRRDFNQKKLLCEKLKSTFYKRRRYNNAS